MECLRLLRQLMMDLAVTTSFGYRLNALRKYTSTQIEDPMSVAIGDFPKRALLVSLFLCAAIQSLILYREAWFLLGCGT